MEKPKGLKINIGKISTNPANKELGNDLENLVLEEEVKNIVKKEDKKNKFEEQINKINDSKSFLLVTVDQSITEEIKKKEKITFNLSDLIKQELLGSGVSGEVYKAIHCSTQKKFALKIIPYKEDDKLKNLIENEVKALHQCKCENLIKCYASYLNDNSVNIVVEFMDKGTLGDVLKKVGKIPENILGIMTVQILKGLEFLHNQKIIHRDIKPSNILVSSKGLVKISDFGVSGYVKDTNGQKESMVGTYLYMAPERIINKQYTMKSDIWSLGMSLLECITGQNPYLYGKKEVINNIQFWDLVSFLNDHDPPKLSPLEFSEEFCDFIACCLVKNDKDRYSSTKLMEHKFISMYLKVPTIELKSWISTNLN